VIDTEGDCAEWSFPAEPDAVRTARTAVRGQLHTWRLDVLGDLAALLVSELVTNSLRHATGPIGVRLVRSPRLPANLLQAQRDYFGSHTYERIDQARGKFFHIDWPDPKRPQFTAE